jgi:uncharacterized protein with NRDE domain
MCLIAFAYKTHPRYSLVVAANRDEFYRRPTAPVDFWPECPCVLAGRDLEQGGTWLGVSRDGRFAALTNYRDPAANRPDARSRGELVRDYLCGSMSPQEYLERVKASGGDYNGFNLLVGDAGGLWYYSNRTDVVAAVAPGVHGLSNHLLDTPWPKVAKAKAGLAACLAGPDDALATGLFALLAERSAWLQHPAQLGLADLDFSRGLYADARQRYVALRDGCRQDAGAPTATAGAQEDDAPTAWCGFRIAQCDEFTGRLAEAVAGYEACAKSEDKDLAAEAGYAVKRVGMLTDDRLTPDPSPSRTELGRGEHGIVRYLGEDRATQGDWYRRYGREAFILCAQQSPQDVAGGGGFGTNPPTQWEGTPSVDNPKEGVRHWVTSRSDDHRSLL